MQICSGGGGGGGGQREEDKACACMCAQEYIESENARLEREQQFWSKEIVVKIEYKYCPNLTIIDTPGRRLPFPNWKSSDWVAVHAKRRSSTPSDCIMNTWTMPTCNDSSSFELYACPARPLLVRSLLARRRESPQLGGFACRSSL